MDVALDDYYRALGERDRLTRTAVGRLEYVRTRELLSRVLPPAPADVLDVGGGTGIHAAWLASAGHRVHVIDPIPEHVAVAAAMSSVSAEVGDARAVPRSHASADVVLLLGPLYHLPDRADRVLALREAARVVRPGCVVVGAAICRHASLLDFAARGLLDDDRLGRICTTVNTGEHDATLGFTDAWFHRAEDLLDEFADAGLKQTVVHGIEGPGYIVLKTAEALGPVSSEVFASALALARAAETDLALIGAGSHLLAIARTPDNG